MKIVRYCALLSTALLLGACASITPVVEPAAKIDPTAGYVSGMFSRNKGSSFGFVLRNVANGQELTMPLGEDSTLLTEITDQVVAIKVPPGRYAIAQWIAYAPLTKEVASRKTITNATVTEPFEVGAGAVVFLGRFKIATTNSYSGRTLYTNWSIQPAVISLPRARNVFEEAYPSFGERPFSCLLCMENLRKAAAGPATQ